MHIRTKLTVTEEQLKTAAAGLELDTARISQLWSALDALVPRTRFNPANFAYYLGAMIVISAMTWYMTSAWDSTGGLVKIAMALGYAAVFAGLGYFLQRQGQRVPSGLLYTAAVCTTPLAVYGFESAFNVWNAGSPGDYSDFYYWVRASWVPMELATIVAGLITVYITRFPFVVAPIAYAAWYASMDLSPLIFHATGGDDFFARSAVSFGVGVVLLAVAVVVDRLTREDYAFWLYLAGSLSVFWGMWDTQIFHDKGYTFALFVSLVLIAASLVLGRRVLAVFGSLGISGYLGHLAWLFRDSLSFPVELAAIGLFVILAGLAYQRNIENIEAAIEHAIPEGVRRLLPRSRLA